MRKITITVDDVSLSARRAWIEITVVTAKDWASVVALRKESVDRNTQRRDFKRLGLVALRKESVDRNYMGVTVLGIQHRVALRKESVDRNLVVAGCLSMLGGSLSARRAWIEMQGGWLSHGQFPRRSPQGERG